MKGVIFQLLEKAVSQQYGAAAWDALLDDAALEGTYTSLGSYPDGELNALVAAASSRFGVPSEDLVRWFGRSALPMLAERYPDFFAPHASTLPFLLTLNDIIHVEVRKLYPGAEVPEFDFEVPEAGVIVMHYRSARSLCWLAEGLIEGAADHFGEDVEISQSRCKLRGDEVCLLRCRFVPRVEEALAHVVELDAHR